MSKRNILLKRVVCYVLGLFLLALGVSFSIQADLGVSPVSSLPYALTLTLGLSIGITTVLANILFIVFQVILNKVVDLKDFSLQLFIAFLFGFFMDASLFLVKLLPKPETLLGQSAYLIISLFIVAIGLLNYFVAKLPLMPYDALTYVISERFKLVYSRAKVTSDLINVGVAGAICLLSIQSFGSIGIGTVVAAYFLGKILGMFMKFFKERLENWINQDNQSEENKQLIKKEEVEV